MESTGPIPLPRCDAAHDADPTPCEGPHRAVAVIHSDGRETTGCVHHAARLLASLEGARLPPFAGLFPWALDVYLRAWELPPCVWEIGL